MLTLNHSKKQIDSLKCNLGNFKRVFTCHAIFPDDTKMFICSKTGDIIEVFLESGIMKRVGPTGKLIEGGIN